MKTKVFKNSMRLIDNGEWWKVEFNERMLYHRCYVKWTLNEEDVSLPQKREWVPTRWIIPETTDCPKFIRCPNCLHCASDDVVAHVNMMGLELPAVQSPSIYEKFRDMFTNKPQLDSPEPMVSSANVEFTWTSDSTTIGNDIQIYNTTVSSKK